MFQQRQREAATEHRFSLIEQIGSCPFRLNLMMKFIDISADRKKDALRQHILFSTVLIPAEIHVLRKCTQNANRVI